MGLGKMVNKPCKCGSGKKFKKCCINKNILTNKLLTGDDAEDLVEKLSEGTFLKPWVFRSPKYLNDNKEYTDVAILFKDVLILIEVKGNKFDPLNPQRYIKKCKERHNQLKVAKNVAVNRLTSVVFKNEYYSFVTNFNNINKVYCISVSAGDGEMMISNRHKDIDFSRIDNYEETQKYIGFYNAELSISNFLFTEFLKTCNYITTIKEFIQFLEFEVKFFSSDYDDHRLKDTILLIDDNKMDLVATFLQVYTEDKDLQLEGKLILDKIIGEETNSDNTLNIRSLTGAENLLSSGSYLDFKNRSKSSYLWDDFINDAIFKSNERFKFNFLDQEEIQTENIDYLPVIEDMALTSRYERIIFCEKIRKIDSDKTGGFNMFSKSFSSESAFSYSIINYEVKPTAKEEKDAINKRLISVWCRLNHSKTFVDINHKIKRATIIIKQNYNGYSKLSFISSDKLDIPVDKCNEIYDLS